MFFKGSRENVLLPLTAKCPSDNGANTNVKFRCRYRLLSQNERKQLVEDTQSGAKNDDDVIRETVTGWEGVRDTNDELVDFNEEALEAAMDFPPYRQAILDGALQLIFGKEVLRQKNLLKSAANS